MTTKVGLGTIIAWSDGASPEVFTAIGKVANIGGPEESAEEVDDTTLDSSGGYTETLQGLKNGGTVSFTMHRNPDAAANQAQLETDFDAATTRKWRITWPFSPNELHSFQAFVQSLTRNTEPNAPITVDVTLKISGPVTRA